MTVPLEKYENNWETSMGAWFPGETAVLRGKDIFADLGDVPWMEYLVFGITGRMEPQTASIVEKLWQLTTSYPEPRIWNNRIAALAATTRSTGALALAAGNAVSEARNYGFKPQKGCIDFLYRLGDALDNGQELADVVKKEIKENRGIFGYGRPIINTDERITPVMNFAKSLGVENRRYIKLAFKVEEYLQTTKYKYCINSVGVACGLLADEGLDVLEMYFVGLLCFSAGIIPCYIDALAKPEGSFFPLRTEVINYSGDEEVRKWSN